MTPKNQARFILTLALILTSLILSGCKPEAPVQNTTSPQENKTAEPDESGTAKRNVPNPEPECGATIDKSYNAPKSISSTQITEFSASFYIDDKEDDTLSGWYQYDLRESDGQYVLKESNKYKIQEIVSSDLLSRIQTVIEKHELIKLNGSDRVTAGLAPEYQPCSFDAHYASGEKLSFHLNNDPDAKWSKEISDLLRATFIERGHQECLPSIDSRRIVDCSITFVFDQKTYVYDTLKDESNANTTLLRGSIIDNKTAKTLSEKTVALPTQFSEALHEFAQLHQLKRFQNGNLPSDPSAPKDPSYGYDIILTYGNYRQIVGESQDKSQYDIFSREIPDFISFMNQYLNRPDAIVDNIQNQTK